MAISRDELYDKIQKWRNGSSKANSKSTKLQDAYLEYLDSLLEKEGYDTFVIDLDTGKETGDYTPEFEATQAEVMDDLGLGEDDMDLIFNGEGDFTDFETEYDDNGLPIKSTNKNPKMGKIADKYAEIRGWDDKKWDSFDWERPLPKFKGKEVSFEATSPDIENIDIYDAVNDPDFKKAFDAMPDEDKEDIIIQIVNAQPDILDHEKVIAMLDADGTSENSDKDSPHDEELVEESEKILDKVGTQVMDNVIDEHIAKTRKAGASFVPHSEGAVRAMLEANKKGQKISDSTMKNIVGTLSQYRW